MFKFFKKKNLEADPSKSKEATVDFMNAVKANAVDRRKHIRVRYPAVGPIGDLPQVYVGEKDFRPLDFSLGGIMLSHDATDVFKSGEKFVLKIVWPKTLLSIEIEAICLRTDTHKAQFQFLQADPKLMATWPQAFKPGVKGNQTRNYEPEEIPPGNDILELWIATTGDLVMFQSAPNTKQETKIISFGQHRAKFESKVGLLIGKKTSPQQWEFQQAAPQEYVDGVLIFLTNFRKPSSRVQNLIHEITTFYFDTKKTG